MFIIVVVVVYCDRMNERHSQKLSRAIFDFMVMVAFTVSWSIVDYRGIKMK